MSAITTDTSTVTVEVPNLSVAVVESNSTVSNVINTTSSVVLEQAINIVQAVNSTTTIVASGSQGPQGPQGLPGIVSEGDEIVYSKRVDFITDNELYKAEAAVGSLESAAAWRIRKVTLSAFDGDVTETWADGTANFDKVWSNRLTYTYS